MTREDPNRPVPVPASVLFDKRLSATAKELYGFLADAAEGGETLTSMSELVELSSSGTERCRRGMKELLETGWVEREQLQGARFGRSRYVVHQAPPGADAAA